MIRTQQVPFWVQGPDGPYKYWRTEKVLRLWRLRLYWYRPTLNVLIIRIGWL